jgi:pilus assembly protein Flp/PilA
MNVLGTYLRLKNRLDNRQEGQGLVEYALIIVLVSIASVVILGTLGGTVASVFTNIQGSL